MEKSPTATRDPAPFRVFVVEDSPPVRERLEELVASVAGVHCAGSAATADEAIRGILDTGPDAVILDIRLAQGSGFDVLRALHHRAPAVDFLVLSSFALEPYRRLAYKLGASAFLDKTTELDAVRGLIETRAAQHSAPHN